MNPVQPCTSLMCLHLTPYMGSTPWEQSTLAALVSRTLSSVNGTPLNDNRHMLLPCPLQMHDLSSRHLAKFIGVAIDTNIVYIVHEEYPMGSLHQLLHDKTKKLDNSFQYSFALDIIKVCVCVCVCVCVYVCVCVCVCVWCVCVVCVCVVCVCL